MISEWRTVCLNDVVSILGDGLHGTPQYDDNGEYYFINGNNLSDGRIVFKGETKKVSRAEYEKYRKDLNQRTILVSINGTLGNVAVYNGEKCILGKSACYFNVKPDVDKDFVRYVVSTETFRDYIRRYANGTTIKNVSLRVMRDYQFLLPELPVQQEIAATLSTIDNRIAANRAINHHLERLAQAIFKSWFVDFEPFGGVIPDTWRKGTLGDILQSIKHPIKAGERPELPYVPIDTIPMNSLALTDFCPNEEAQSSLLTFAKDDILIGAMRVYFHRVAIAAFDGITRTTCFVLRPRDRTYLEYALLLCNEDTTIDYAQNTSKGSTMPYAVWDNGLANMPIAIPSPDVAQEFSDILHPIIERLRDSLFEIRNLSSLRDSLLPRLMSGELSVADHGDDK